MSINILSLFKKKKNIRLIEFIYSYCNRSKRGKNHVRFYRRLASLIEKFEISIHREIYTDSFTDEVVEEYIHFIRSSKPLKKGHNAYRQSTIHNFIQKTVSMLNKAYRMGYDTDLEGFRELHIFHEECEAIYLTVEELDRINRLSLKRELAQVRDLFLIGCCTALRYSDYSCLSKENFQDDGNITITTKKTNTKVLIPAHYLIKEVIDRNGGYVFFKYLHSAQNFNMRVKIICKKAGINDKILVERTEGFKRIRKTYKKYELVSSHTARRSAATNMYLAGIATFRIMLVTGHKTESAFFRYIRIRRQENATHLQQHPYFNRTLLKNEREAILEVERSSCNS